MNAVLLILTCGTGFYIFIEDIRFRAVRWILFPALWIAGFLYSANTNHSAGRILVNLSVNYLIILFQLFFLLLYSKLRDHNISGMIGAGDILFILAAATFFSPLNFIAYLIISMTFSLLLHLLFVYTRLYPGKQHTVPLAGLQSIILTLILMVSKIYPRINITDDGWILDKLLFL